MADVQAENGYTRIANELLEVVMQQKFNGTQFKIIMAVWRFTYGFQRKDHELSLSFLSKATGVHKQQLKQELDKLIEGKVITVTSEGSFTSSRKIAFNKNYDEWNNLQSVNPLTVSESTYTTVSESTYTTVSEFTYQERNIKESIKEIYSLVPFQEIIDYLNQKTGKSFKASSKATQKHVKARWEEKFTLDDFKRVIDKKSSDWMSDSKMSKFLRPETLFGNKFEGYLNEVPIQQAGTQFKPRQQDQSVIADMWSVDEYE